eukprot:COSAG01_NODE_19609_length_1000_cov_1.744728_2_plen_112_part_01
MAEEVVPLAVCATAVPDAQGLALHVAAASVPVVQLDVPETVYPALHVGLQDAPDARLDGQLPLPPFAGAALASHTQETVNTPIPPHVTVGVPPQPAAALMVPREGTLTEPEP